jgi:hypothetical protein
MNEKQEARARALDLAIRFIGAMPDSVMDPFSKEIIERKNIKTGEVLLADVYEVEKLADRMLAYIMLT